MLATALRNNPDIRVAEAKLHEAEANLNKARIQVMQQVMTMKNAVDAQKKAVELAEQTHKRLLELHATVPQSEIQQSEALLVKAKAELAKLEADLAIPLGRLPGKYDTVDLGTPANANPWQGMLNLQGYNSNLAFPNNTLWNNVLNVPQVSWNLTQLQPFVLHPDGSVRTIINFPVDYSNIAPPAKAAAGSMSERIVIALDKPIKIEPWKDSMTVGELIEYLQKKTEDVPLRFLATAKAREPVQMMKGDLTLGAWLQALEDSVPELVFMVRDYGILVTTRDRAPRDAETLRQFWRRAKDDKAKEAEKAPPPIAK
jgi:hypothetical protein